MIGGSKGGGKSGGGAVHVPTEADDTLKSKSYAKVLDLISEGEIDGLALPGLQGVYLDDTPVENEDGSYNFTGIDFAFREGTQHQSYIPAFPEVERERVVNVEVKKDAPIVETVVDLDIDAVRVKVAVARLSRQETNGDIVGHTVSYAIETKESAGTWVERITDTMDGKSSGRYEREYAIGLEGQGPWQVRVVRTSEDDTKSSEQSETYFASMTEVILAKLSYPNSALAGLVVDSAQFSSIPTRTYLVKGIKVRVPSNYDPETRDYSGIWDGSFKYAWTCNPAWILYDLVVEARYGLGDYLTADNIDKWWLYTISQYCDELVPDGFGGMEPRFEMHCEITAARQAMQVLNEVVSCFNAMILWDGLQIVLSQDAPKDPVKRFTNANVKEGKFSYAGSSKTARHTVALVEWINPENSYQSEIEYIEDQDGIRRYGYNEIQVAAFGCNSRGQATRKGRHILLSERLETDTVTFVAGLEAVEMMPGEVIEIADSHRQGVRHGGRVLGYTSNSVTIDQAIDIEAGKTYALNVALADGGYAKRTVNNPAGSTSVLGFSEALPAEGLVDFAVWVVSEATLDTSLWRVLTIAEKDAEYQVTALQYYPGKQDAIEQGVALEVRNTTRSRKPLKPVNLRLSEHLYESAGRVLNSIEISCDRHIEALEYAFSYSRSGETWVDIQPAGLPEAIVRDVEPGQYRIRAKVKSPFGDWSPWAFDTVVVLGKTAPPGNVQNLSGRVVGDQFKLSWSPSSDLDVLIGGQVLIRQAQSGSSWNAAADIGESVAGTATSASVPLINGAYLVKFIDSSQKTSNDAAVVTTTGASIYDRNVVEEVQHGPAFPGVASGLSFIAGDDVLRTDSDGQGGYVLSASYEMQGPDLGAVYTSRITFALQMQIYRDGELFDSRPGLVDDWESWDQIPDGSRVDFEFQYTADNPADPLAVWTPWEKFFVGDYAARGTRFRVIYTSEDPVNIMQITTAKAVIDMPDVIDARTGLTCPVEGVRVSYVPKYFGDVGPPGITAVEQESGDYHEISNADKAGFDIRFFNASGTPVQRVFNYIQKSY